MNTHPLISVVTPTLNQADFIRQTIDSVLNQDYPSLDYVVRDGGSSDGTLDILKSYGSRLRWISTPDNGQSAAINSGWCEAHGDVLAYLNSDDLYTPGALQHVGSFFTDHPEIDLLYGNCDYIDAAGNVTGSYPTRAYDYALLVSGSFNYLPQPAVFIRRRVWDHIGPLDENLHFVMDFEYWLRAGLAHRAVYLPHKLAALRLHTAAKSVAKVGGFGKELITVYQRLFSNPELPAEIKELERKAMANVFTYAADTAFWSGDFNSARSCFWQAWRHAPLRPRLSWVWMALGGTGKFIAEHLFGNPYLAK